jgi:hypothetical protein
MWVQVVLIGIILILTILLIWSLYNNIQQSRHISTLYEDMQQIINDNKEVIHGIAEPDSDPDDEFVEIIIGTHNPTPTPEQVPTPETRGIDYYEQIAYNNHNDDAQNVHNSQVVRDLRRRYDKLIEVNASATIVPTDMTAHISSADYLESFIQSMFIELGNYCQTYFDLTADKFEKAQKVIETARKGAPFMGFATLENPEGVREDLILAHVWYRIQSPVNADNKTLLLNSLMDQIQDAGKYALNINLENVMGLLEGVIPRQELTTECTQGRVGRYLQTFTLLDNDPLLSTPIKDDKLIENEAYAKSSVILAKYLDTQPGLNGVSMNVLYATVDDDLSPEERVHVDAMKDRARNEIRTTIMQDYDGVIPGDKLANLIDKCTAGV